MRRRRPNEIAFEGDCAVILTSRGVRGLIDIADVARAGAYTWTDERRKDGHIILVATTAPRRLTIHRFLTSAAPGQIVDHANGDTLDNRQSNLRLCDAFGNSRNSRISKRNKTGFKGVAPYHKLFRAQSYANGRQVFLGNFSTPEEAAHAFDAYARKAHGSFACVNFPRPGERGARHIREEQ